MNQNNSLKNSCAGASFLEQKAAHLQIAEAKQRQKEDAKRRALEKLGGKSGAAAQLTATPQSEVTQQPPNLYQVAKINTPDNLGDMTRLLHSELTKIAQSQSILLTLWQQQQDAKDTITELRQQVRTLEQQVSMRRLW